MTMRDLQRIEHLSSTAALGLWADDIVLALDRARTDGIALEPADRQLLTEAADVLDETLERAASPLSAPRSSRALVASDTTLNAVALVAKEQSLSSHTDLLKEIAGAVRAATQGNVNDQEHLDHAMALFGIVGESQLMESNAVLTAQRDSRAWTATQAISSSF